MLNKNKSRQQLHVRFVTGWVSLAAMGGTSRCKQEGRAEVMGPAEVRNNISQLKQAETGRQKSTP